MIDGMVPVAADHAADVVDRDVFPGLIADMLPAGDLFEHQQADFVAGIEKMARLRIVRGAHDVALELLLRMRASRRCTRAGMAWPTKGKV